MAVDFAAWLRTNHPGWGVLVLLLLSVSHSPRLSAATPDPPRFEPVAIPGLSHETVSAMVQDREGFLWFGTWDGLDRWDGREVKNHSHDPGDPRSLSNSHIAALLVDSNGSLWVATLGGIQRYDRRSREFQRFELPEVTDGGDRDPTRRWTLYEAADQTIWVGTNNGLFVLHPGDGSFRAVDRIQAGMPAGSAGVVRFDEDSHGVLWLMATDRFYRSAALYEVTEASAEQDAIGLARHEIAVDQAVSFLIDDRDHFWMNGTAPRKLDAASGRFAALQADAASLPTTAHLQDRAGRVWIGSISGLYLADPGNARAVAVPLSRREGYVDDFVLSIFEDDAGSIWVSTIAGLYRHDPARKSFFTLQENPAVPGFGLTTNRVASVVRDPGGDIWAAGWGAGLDRVHAVTGKTQHYPQSASAPGALPEAAAYFLHIDSRGRLWAAGGEFLCRYVRTDDRFSCVSPGAATAPEPFRAMADGPDGKLFLASRVYGLLEFDPETERFRQRLAEMNASRTVECMAATNSGLWMVASSGRLIRLDFDSGLARQFDLADAFPGQPPLAREYYDVHVAADGVLWMGTSHGLLRFDPETRGARAYTREDGLPGSYVYAILADGGGSLWVSTNRGLVRFDERLRGRSRFRTYDHADGVGSMEFNRGARFRSRDGRFYFGGKEGVTWFDPGDITNNPYVPPLALADISITDRDGRVRLLNESGAPLVVGPNDHSLTLQFAALSFTDPAKNRYRYRLEGFDGAWNDAGSRNTATYTSLPAGDYIFRFVGSNNDSVWNEAGHAVPVTVVPPWWATWWFRVLVAAIAIATLALAYRWRVTHLLEMERLRRRIADDLHDDLSSDLSGIALTMDILEQREALDDHDRQRIAQVRSTALGMIDGVRDLVWYLDTGHDTIGALWQRMHTAADSLLPGRRVTLRKEVGDDATAIDMTLRRQVFLIFKELLHNIAKHSDAGRVWVDLRESRGRLLLSVRDDGIGFDASGTNRGRGLGNLQRRAGRLGGRIDIESAVGRGSRITLVIPLVSSPRGQPV